MNEEIFKKYRLVNGLRILNGCPYCQGALTSGYELKVYKCFQCARMYRVEDGYLKLWPYREYEHLPHRKTLVLRGGIQITLDG
jgi:hypothetical protein